MLWHAKNIHYAYWSMSFAYFNICFWYAVAYVFGIWYTVTCLACSYMFLAYCNMCLAYYYICLWHTVAYVFRIDTNIQLDSHNILLDLIISLRQMLQYAKDICYSMLKTYVTVCQTYVTACQRHMLQYVRHTLQHVKDKCYSMPIILWSGMSKIGKLYFLFVYILQGDIILYYHMSII
jgi:hypothetical protein